MNLSIKVDYLVKPVDKVELGQFIRKNCEANFRKGGASQTLSQGLDEEGFVNYSR